MAATRRISLCCRSLPPTGVNAQESSLHAEGHLGDLVEKERAAVGASENAVVGGDRAGKRTSSVAEELTLQHTFADGAAIQTQKRPRRA